MIPHTTCRMLHAKSGKFLKIGISLIPIIGGIIVGNLINTNKTASSQSLPVPATSPETSTPKAVPHSISHYLLTSQSLFSEAIALSQETQIGTDKKAQISTDNNKRIAELVNEAISQATQAIAHYPNDPRGWAQRAKIYQSVEKYLENAADLAISDYKMALQLDRQNPEYPQKLSQLYRKRNDLSSAVAYLKIAAEAAPTDAQIWFDLAKLQAKAGQIQQAKKTYQRILPLLADSDQKQLIKKEIIAIDSLLAKVENKLPNISSATPTPEKNNNQIELIEDAPLLQASNNQHLIIAAGESEKENSKAEISQTNALSGNAIIRAGETETKIENSQLTTYSQVYITPIGDDQNQVLRVKKKVAADVKSGKPGYFTVAISRPLNHDLEFKWWIIKK